MGDTSSVKMTTVEGLISFPVVTSGLGSVILAVELFVDGRLIEGGSGTPDSFAVRVMDHNTTWTLLGALVDGSSTDVPLEGGPPHGTQAGNADNVFFTVGPAFFDGLLAGTLQVQIEKTANRSSGGADQMNTDDYINGVNLQISSTTPAPEPTSMLLFGTMLAGLGWVSRKRFSK